MIYKFKKELIGVSIEVDGIKKSWAGNVIAFVGFVNATSFKVRIVKPGFSRVVFSTDTVFINDVDVSANAPLAQAESLRDNVFMDAIDGVASPIYGIFTTDIPFNLVATSFVKTVDGPLAFSRSVVGARPGYGSILRLSPDGVNVPTFSGLLKKSNASADYVNSAGVVNVVIFFFDGVDYWYTIYQQSGASNIIPVAPVSVSDDNANTQEFTHALGYAEIEVMVGGAAYVALTAVAGWNGATNKIDVGNVVRAAGYYFARTKAAAGRDVSATVSSNAFTVAAIDSHVTTWANNGGITDNVYIGYISTFVTALKSANIFLTHFDFLQILCGGTAGKVKLNLLSPLDADANYRLAFPNGATFAATGLITDGAGQFIDTFFVPSLSAIMTSIDYHFSFFSRTAAGGAGFNMGVYAAGVGIYAFARNLLDQFDIRNLNAGEVTGADASGRGFYFLNAQVAVPNLSAYKDGVQVVVGSNNGNNEVLPISKMPFQALRNETVVGSFRAGELSIISGGKGMNTTQRQAYETAIANLVTSLGL